MGHLFSRMSLNLVYFFFFMTRFRLSMFGRNIIEVIFYSPLCILSGGTWFWIVPLMLMFILITWLKWPLTDFFVKLLFLLATNILWNDLTIPFLIKILPICSFTCIGMDSCFLLYSVSYNLLLLCPFDMFPPFSRHFLAFNHKMFQDHLILSLFQSWNPLHLQKLGSQQVCPLHATWIQDTPNHPSLRILSSPIFVSDSPF